MNRPVVEVADILRLQGDAFIDRNRHRLRFRQLKVIRAIVRCRTAALGGHIDTCKRCGGDSMISYNSCRDRHCPKCQNQARQRWIEARTRELLETRYFHVVFTLPHELHPLILQNQARLYDTLFQSVAQTLLEVARNPRHLGAEIGFFAILHTWGQNMLFHPHIHCVIPAGGLALDHTRWIHPRYPFFLPVRVLRKVFRGKFVHALRKAFHQERLSFNGQIQYLAHPKHFAAFLRTLFRQDWVVYAKPAFGGPAQVLRYLGRYTHRVAISNHRLLSFDGDHVSFRWRDYARGNKQRKMTVSADEFIRRFLLHVLPKGFVRIRHFGFMANAHRSTSMKRCQRLLGMAPIVHSPDVSSTHSGWLCPVCRAPMVFVARLNAAQIAWRFPTQTLPDTS